MAAEALSAEKIIEVKGLTKKYGSITAVKDLDLSVYRGDVIGFLGPNGAGKSTTIRMLLSLIKPTSGKIKIFDESIKNDPKPILSKIGAIVEKPDFYLYFSGYKNLELLGKLSKTDVTKKRIREVLKLVGLDRRRHSKVKTYSHGMKQRLGIAQALLHDPELIILDEPTTGLDPQGIKEIRELIIHLSENEKKTIFLSSHILKGFELVASRMIIINNGKTQVEGNVEELLNSSEMKVRVEVDDVHKAMALVNNSSWSKQFIEIENNKIVFELEKEQISSLNKFLVENNVDVNSLVPIRSLEDYFLKITNEATD